MDNLSTDTSFFNELKTQELQAASLTITTPTGTVASMSAGVLNTDSVSSDNLSRPFLTVDTIECTGAATADNATSATVECSTLNVNTINTTIYTINTLFADEIKQQQDLIASQSYTTTTHTTTGLSTGQIVAITFAAILSVALIAATIGLVVGVATTAATMAATFNSAAVIYGAGISTTASYLVGYAAAAVMTTGTIAAVTTLTAATIAVAAVAATLPGPTYKTSSVNSTYGRSFVSNSIFGTTSYIDATAPYVNYLLLSNEINGSVSLPQLVGYNPQLGFFDDGAFYGSQKAYFSMCTPTPYNTLRFQDNGNFAIYDSPLNAPTWQTGTQVSDARLKRNIEPITQPLERLLQISGVRYRLKGEEETRAGVIAQEVKEVLPEAVFGDEDAGYRVRLERIVPLLIESMKELYELQEVRIARLR